MANPQNLTPGNLGNKGGGRTPEAFREMCREAVSRADRFAIAEKVIENPDHPAWLGAYKFLTETGFGKAKESHEHSVTVKAYVTFDPEKDV